ncbi:MAG: M48 family metallopeptidase [Deltaproteobacteria bacterium]|nr:M48 family metallopeptidase [Deltaproteobacteria bacterium]
MENLLLAIILAYISITCFHWYLEFLNLRNLKDMGENIPPEFEGHVDRAFLSKARNYLIENTRFGIVSSAFSSAVLLMFLFVFLEEYNSWAASLGLRFKLSGLVFYLLLFYADTVLSIPFSLYRTFGIEKKYGFNAMTPGLWITDLLKSTIVSTVIMSVLIIGGLFIVEKSPSFWWFYVWCLFFLITVFMMYVSPYLIEPLFNKFERIDDKDLEDGIEGLAVKAGIKVKKILRIDASKRTTHTNAYFTGIGNVKRIVLYDTLLEKLNKNEILSVLAHEIGHWRKRHILKQMIFIELTALIVFYAAFRILDGRFLNRIFAIEGGSFFTEVFILGFIGAIAAFPFGPLMNYLSRKYENEADIYACRLSGGPSPMITALVKLTRDNLSNLHPHPLYVTFNYSHPPVIERIRHINEKGGEGKTQ